MKKQTIKLVTLMAVSFILLTVAPMNTAYAGTKILGWDITASYTSLKQKVMEKVFGVSFPKNLVDTDGTQNGVNTTDENTGNTPNGSSINPIDTDSLVRQTFTQKQVNDALKSAVLGKNLGSGVVIKAGNIEFLADNNIHLTAEIATNIESAKTVKTSATLTVIENGTRLKMDTLDIEGAGVMANILKPIAVKYFESQQEELIKKYAPADFAFIEVKAGLVTVYLNR